MVISAPAILTAALLVGQTPEIPTTPTTDVGAKTVRQSQPWFPRLQKFFNRPAGTPEAAPVPTRSTVATTTSKKPTPSTTAPAPSVTPSAPTQTAPTTQPPEFPRRMPMGSTRKNTEVVPVQSVQTTAPTVRQTQSPILPINANRIGREDNFKWVTGQIEITKSGAYLYYATPDTVDPHNGVVVLQASAGDLKQFQSGDLVSAQGTLQARASGQTPIYRVTSIDLIERPKR